MVGCLAQQRVELGSVGAVLHRIHPHQDPVEVRQLGADLLDSVVGVHHRLDRYVQVCERPDQGCEHGLGPFRLLAGLSVSPRQQPDADRLPTGCCPCHPSSRVRCV
jgi:hypothetical protein